MSTKIASPSTVRASSTVELSRASKNTSLCKAHAKGEWAESKVVQYLKRRNFRILKTRWRTTYAEIDLIAESPRNEIFIFEIKSLSSFDFLAVRVGRKQKARLKRAFLYVQGKTTKPLRLALAFVDKRGEILIFEDF